MYDHKGVLQILVGEIAKGDNEPVFQITVRGGDTPKKWTHSTSSGVWASALKEIKNRPTVSVSGPEVCIAC